jgi:MAP3K TRAFs-binding domain
MPFGRKHDPAGGPDIDFDRTYETAIKPAILDAQLDPIRADNEIASGVIHKAMFERLLLCDFAVADLTTANANVFYELGVRHAARPHTTLTLFATQQPIPFDVNMLRAIPYSFGPQNSFPEAEARALRSLLAKRLGDVRELAFEQAASDSPLVQLLQGYRCPDVGHLLTDVFHDQVVYAETLRRRLREARAANFPAAADALATIETDLGALDGVDAGVLIDLFLSYRAVESFDAMIALYPRLPEAVRSAVLVREQLAFALNRKAATVDGLERANLRGRATQLLEQIVADGGPNSETCGLLGRILKDRWDQARTTDPVQAKGFLRRAIKEYIRGFEADWRDPYPGINAVTLLDIEGSPPSLLERDRLVPVVRYAVEQRLRGSQPSFWDHATLLELSILAGQPEHASQHLEDALAAVGEGWQPRTTARNLALLRDARAARGQATPWLDDVVASLEAAGEAGKSP